MSKLTNYRLLSFDVYGTLIDWETGVWNAIQPTLASNNAPITRSDYLKLYQELEKAQQTKTPDMPYSQLLSTIHPQIASRLALNPPTAEESNRFGESVGQWPAFPDTVEALKRLSKHYKLVVLSNVDRESFQKTNAGSLQGFPFDLVITAQDVGSYKPNVANFEYMLKAVKEQFGVEAEQVLQTAQSQFHDHHPAKKMGLRSSWIERPGALMGNLEDTVYDWKFDTLGDMADAVERELLISPKISDFFNLLGRWRNGSAFIFLRRIHPSRYQQQEALLEYGNNHPSYKSYVTSAGHLGENYAQPTVLADMTHDMRLASEETFGTVAVLFAFDEEGGGGGGKRLFPVAEALEVGMVGANTGIISNVAAPFGGIKESGFGREGSKYGIDEFTHVKTITIGGLA
ncbi:HAD-like domain-containing protein [Aspergillus transmontanensis]|uniref:HAD-like domain-containing protein n=1 Tax=Aspergillus transmontanensis TaxID=1034304 RepID=A0A5N6VMM4_9EURO|nr:HAD-like domain-containing protein [Aspergillus transmontanensis]